MAASSETSEPRRRGPGRPWQPGQSGNPSGLSRDTAAEIQEARALALSHAPYAIQRLRDLLDSGDEGVVAEAARALLDRGGLRPYSVEPEKIEITAIPINVDELRESLMVRVAALAALPASMVDATPEEATVPPRDAEPCAITARPLPEIGNQGSGGPPETTRG